MQIFYIFDKITEKHKKIGMYWKKKINNEEKNMVERKENGDGMKKELQKSPKETIAAWMKKKKKKKWRIRDKNKEKN